MIGKFIRSYRHLLSNVDNKPKRVFFIRYNNVLQSDVIKTRYNKKDDIILFFQSVTNSFRIDLNVYKDRDEFDSIKHLYSLYGACHGVLAQNQFDAFRFKYGKRMLILPHDFDEKYEEFINANKKILSPIFDKYGLNTKHPIIQYFYACKPTSPNFVLWAVKNYCRNGVPLSLIEAAFTWSENYGQLASKLSKGTITAYNGYDKVFDFIKESRSLRKGKRANDVINSFNTAQKKSLKEVKLDDNILNILNRFGRLSKVKQSNFIRKMSTVTDNNEIIRNMSFLANVHFDWNKESLLEYINKTEDLKCKVVYDNDCYLLIECNNYDTIRRIAKNTNWCISKNKRYFDDYITNKNGEAIQYVLCDFSKNEDDKFSMIGFTSIFNNGITNAHNYVNDNIIGNRYFRNCRLTSIFDNVISNNIYEILKKANIPNNLYLHSDKIDYEWSKEGFLGMLHKCIGKNEYIMYYDNDNKLLLSTSNNNICYLLGEQSNRLLGDTNNKIFVFADFTKSIDDSTKVLYGIVEKYTDGQEFVLSLYDEYGFANEFSFEELIEDCNLPYDIIKRIDTPFNKFKTYFFGKDLKMLDKCLKNEDIVNEIKKQSNQNFCDKVQNELYYQLLDYKTFDTLNVLYDNNVKLSDLIGVTRLSNLMHKIYCHIIESITINGEDEINEDVMNDFLNGKIVDNNDIKYQYGMYHMYQLIRDNETEENIFFKILSEYDNNTFHNNISCNIICDGVKNCNIKKIRGLLGKITKVAVENKRNDILEVLADKGIEEPNVLDYIVNHIDKSNPLYDRFTKLYKLYYISKRKEELKERKKISSVFKK